MRGGLQHMQALLSRHQVLLPRKENKDFCLVTDSDIHVNAHFIGKQGKGRDFTWVQSIGVLFGSQQFYVGARKVATWHGSDDNMHVQFNGADINIPSGDGEMWTSPEGDLQIKRVGETNSIVAEVVGVVKIGVRVVPITEEESRIHGYGITEDDCFAHLELSFKFSSLSNSVSGVLGQTYVPGYRSPVKIGVPMPVMVARRSTRPRICLRRTAPSRSSGSRGRVLRLRIRDGCLRSSRWNSGIVCKR
uniref:Uncharacterized protein n=1 Tax=Ananas comosus var. bracteatus TaxID=296719 RepID=A0A6V7QPC2_ANACO|nr:unnamed protein product [Ananas comosus var. bracteatus]